MVKYCVAKYPKGSFPGQQTDGKYADSYLYDNIKILSETITNDMTFLGVLFSSTLEVGTGKSTLAQQIAEMYTEQVNQIHGLNLTFTKENIVFKPKDLVERSLKLPKYSCIILDEWEDAHYWSELGTSLRKFFRKCRQLNLFMIIIIPDFFQLPIGYAISRSVFGIDVRFEGKFERGFFRFYNYDKKKDLYIKGKKMHDYGVVQSNFFGRFPHGYAIPEDEYRYIKMRDLKEAEEDDRLPTEKEIKADTCKKLKANNPKLTNRELGLSFGVSERTINRWLHDEKDDEEGDVVL